MGSKIQTEEWPKKNCFRDSRQVTSQRISRCWFNDFCWWFLSFFRLPERINCQVTRPVFHSHIEGTDPPYPLTWLDMLKLLCRASIFELSHPKPIETSLVTLVYSFIPIMSLSYTRICYIYIYVSYIILYIYIYVCYIIYYITISLYKHTLCIHYAYIIYILYINLLSLSCPPLNSAAPESRGPPCALRGQRRGRSAQRGEGLGEGLGFGAITGRPRNPFLLIVIYYRYITIDTIDTI
jgi:hypothetical protein